MQHRREIPSLESYINNTAKLMSCPVCKSTGDVHLSSLTLRQHADGLFIPQAQCLHHRPDGYTTVALTTGLSANVGRKERRPADNNIMGTVRHQFSPLWALNLITVTL